MQIADVALLITYAAVTSYFLRRFYLKRKPPSLYIALLPMGWVVLAIHRHDEAWLPLVKWCGVALGLLLMLAVFKTDRAEPGP